MGVAVCIQDRRTNHQSRPDLEIEYTDPKVKIKLAFQHISLYLHLPGSMLSNRCRSLFHHSLLSPRLLQAFPASIAVRACA